MTDQQLLHDYADRRSEAAFAEFVRRQVDFVYSAALRMVRDSHLAEDVTQAVFVALAQNAHKLADHPVLAGWLHRTTQNLAAKTVRSEMRRRNREHEAADMNQLLAPQNDAVWEEIAPHLDAAVGELNAADRDVLLLRYFQRKSADEMAQILHISSDAAQKRVNRALDRLRERLSKRSIAVGAGGLAVIISANALQAAPAGLATTIATTAGLAGTTLAATTLTKTIVMTTLQKTFAAVTLVVAAGTGVYEARQASQLRDEVQNLRRQQAPLNKQLEQLQRERDNATNRLASLADELARGKSNNSELLKLRAEVGRLRNEAGQPGDSTQQAMKSWLKRVDLLKQRLQQTPEADIPELALADDEDWLAAVKERHLDSEYQFRWALSTLRNAAESKFATALSPALDKYLKANGGQFPTDVAQLSPYFDPPVDSAIFQRWAVVPAKMVPGLGMGDQIITEKAPVDELLDMRHAIGKSGNGSIGFLDTEIRDTLKPVYSAYSSANGGNFTDFEQSMLLPYAKTPEQQAAVKKLMAQAALRKE